MSAAKIEQMTYCRTCLSSSSDLLAKIDGELVNIIHEFASIKITTSDPKLSMICDDCRRIILEFRDFKVKCLNAETFFQSFETKSLTSVKVESDFGTKPEKYVAKVENKCVHCPHCYAENNKVLLKARLPTKRKSSVKKLTLEGVSSRLRTRDKKRKNITKKRSNSKNTMKLDKNKCEYGSKRMSTKQKSRQKKTTCDTMNNAISKNEIDDVLMKTEGVGEISSYESAENFASEVDDNNTSNTVEFDDYTHPVQCHRCCEVFSNKKILNAHMKTHITSMKCPECEKNFERVSLLLVHIKTDHMNIQPSIKCESCEEKFYVELQLDRHLAKKHCPKACPHCGKQISVRNLNRHIEMVHSGPREKSQCDKCQRFFKHELTLKMHIKYAHEDKPKICTVCGLKVFHMTKHMRRYHSGQVIKTMYTCRFCRVQFDQMTTLRRHQNAMHAEERQNEDKKFECKLCGKMFLNRSNLLCHRNTSHNNQLRFECSVCNKRFKRKQLVKSHMRLHTDERPYVCDVCDKRFRHNSTLMTHRRTHTGERPYRCVICDKAFAQNCVWRTHMRTHVDQPYFAAPIFGSASAQQMENLSSANVLLPNKSTIK